VRALPLVLILIAGPVLADEADEAALKLADTKTNEAVKVNDWRLRLEGALLESSLRANGETQHAQRLSLDFYYDKKFAPDWRVKFNDRLDIAWRGKPTYDDAINTFKEMYVSWQPQAENIFDLGRINARYGVALGYNPTDFFRANTARAIYSADPASAKENRMGTVMLRGQSLWRTGSLTAIYAPKLAEDSNSSPFSPDIGATNNQPSWLLALTQKLDDGFTPQWLLFNAGNGSPQVGVNLAVLPTAATVAYAEWSGGRNTSLVASALGRPQQSAFRSRLATGITYTAPSKLALTLEYQFNGAALAENDWNALRQGAVNDYAQYRGYVAQQQELPTKRNLFLYARWQDWMMPNLDLGAMRRVDLIDHSHLSWLEARYHWDRIDLALQWQRNSGDDNSQYGALPQRQSVQFIVTSYF
jgi:hypothetical protein